MKIKNLYILTYTYLEKSRYKRYFNCVTEYKIIENSTDNKINKLLIELNKNKRTNFWIILKVYDFKKLSDKKKFIFDYIELYKKDNKFINYKELYLTVCSEVIK